MAAQNTDELDDDDEEEEELIIRGDHDIGVMSTNLKDGKPSMFSSARSFCKKYIKNRCLWG